MDRQNDKTEMDGWIDGQNDITTDILNDRTNNGWMVQRQNGAQTGYYGKFRIDFS